MTNNLYEKGDLKNLSKLKELAPEQLEAFSDFNTAVMTDGALSKKEKEIIAVAIAHVTECPYCIDLYTRRAKAEGALLEELVEAIFIVAGVEAGGVVTHSTHIHNAMDARSRGFTL
ncbi:carboxymuconolactone decarboxylase family protein [Bacillus sp. ISL-40]|uniref:carboxymuconolactone decarboxylase family protein n=1 Tax=Bacillus sp. ISL-40 TaxID=2819126 RepID=UPI002035F109|nr:carboxymuconolactone decarboxylase family protein [Bacillus sp. ISL-40]